MNQKIKNILNYPPQPKANDDDQCIWTPRVEPCASVGGVLAVVGTVVAALIIYHLYKVCL